MGLTSTQLACCATTVVAAAAMASHIGIMNIQMCACIASAAFGALLSTWAMEHSVETFVKAGRFGIDLNKSTTIRDAAGELARPVCGAKVPEPMGLVPAAVFMLCLTCFLPFAFDRAGGGQFVELVAALLSITCATFLGFADDVFDVPGRYRIVLSFATTLPLLLVYCASVGRTSMLIPPFLQKVLGIAWVELGFVYYGVLAFQAVFSTMAINVLAGVNGLESGQSVIIGASIVMFNLVQLARAPLDWESLRSHQFSSLYIAVPFTAVSTTLWLKNKWPATVFCGDTYCYFAGMSIAACAIVGHFSKMLWLFLLPQGINFLYMLPQYLRYHGHIPCPRHRMPVFDVATGNVKTSMCEFKLEELSGLGRFFVKLYRALRLVQVEELADGFIRMSNLTLICLVLVKTGPIREDCLCARLLVIQALASGFAFFVRFCVVRYFYDEAF